MCGSVQIAGFDVPQVSASLTGQDYWGLIKVRWGVGRMHYRADPGLYALGKPDPGSPVLVTANYKMSFDRLREALPCRSAWILALDTDGVNVWCAAGKGTFGTEELTARVHSSGLSRVVRHRTLILPQLGAPGVSAHHAKALCGFKIIYGPIRAKDLPAFLDSGLKATPEMRRQTFNLLERMALIPIELVSALKIALFVIPALCLLSGLGGPEDFWSNVGTYGGLPVVALFGATVAGTVLTPVFLPWLPGRAFSVKGLGPGLLLALALILSWGIDAVTWSDRLGLLAWLLIVPAATTYLAMNFTGASTYTSLSGVKKEMRWALPLQIATAFVGLFLWLISRFMA